MLTERKIALSFVLAMLLLVMMLPFNAFDNIGVYAIPSEPPPPPPQPPEHHPHWTPGLTNYIPGTGTVTWARNWATCVLNPNDVAHQHHDMHDFQGANGTADPGPEPYSAWAVWDNRKFRVDDLGSFDRGHGFINEFPWLGGGADQIPRYHFSLIQRDGVTPCNWPAQAQANIRTAFGMWDAVWSDQGDLVVGFAFRETSPGEQAEIVLYWQLWSALGEVANPPPLMDVEDWMTTGPVEVVFASNVTWEFGAIYETDDTEYHFLTTALHEIGHVVGLDEQNDQDDVMYRAQAPGQNGPCFDTIDPDSLDSLDGVRDLYSIPQYDFGDAPDNYPVKLANGGAYSMVTDEEWLGRLGSVTSIEREPRQVDRDWPDDGVEFMLGGTGGQVKVTVSVFDHLSQRYQGTYKLYVAVWMDFDFDQDWKTSNNELILWTRIDPLTEMQGNTYTTSWVPFSYPSNFLELLLFYGKTWARARLVYADTGGTLTSDQGDEGLLPPIESPDNGGEIEDHIVYPSWPMFRHDPRHTGNSISTAPNKKGVLWNYTTAGSVRSSPAVVDGRLFVGSDDCRVYALNATTGSLIWDYVTPQPVPSSPAVAFGMVFANSVNHSTFALDANTGALIWIQSFGVSGAIGELSPAVAYGKIFVALGHYLDVAAVNAMTGELVWASNLTGGATSSPAAADGMVFIGAGSGRVYALNAETGTHVWNYITGGAVCSSPTISNDRVFAGSYDGNIYALNATTGVLSWSYPTGNPIDSSPAVADNRLLIGSGNDVYALNATTGTLLWKYSTGGTVKSSPAIADDKVFIGSYDYRIYALNLTSGAVIWSYNGGNKVESSPAVAESKVFAGIGNKVYAFGPYYHNIAIEQVTITKSVVGQGFSLSMNVTVENQGNFTETFNLTALANMTSIALQPLILTSGNSATIPFSWNTSGFAYGNYTMGAYTTLLQDETDWTDNIYTDGTVAVTIPGDVNGDFQVKPYDLALLIASYGSDPYPPNPRPWNPNCDINGDDKVGPYDLALLITHYGQHYP